MGISFRKIGKKNPNPFEKLLDDVTTGIQNLFPELLESSSEISLESPPNHIQADYAFSTFSLAGLIMQDPVKISYRIVKHFTENPLQTVKKIFAVGPYVNIELDKKNFREKVIDHIAEQEELF